MGKRKERRLAAMMAAGRRVKLDLFAEPSGDLGGSSAKDEVGKEVDAKSDTELPNSPSSSGQQAENPLSLLGQYSDDELDERSMESASAPDGSLVDDDKQAKVLDGKQSEEGEVGVGKNTSPELEADSASPSAPIAEDVSASNTVAVDEKTNVFTVQNGPVPNTFDPQTGVVSSSWKMVLHEESNRYYYWNTVTGETSWEVPDAVAQETGLTSELEVLGTEMKESAAGDANALITSIGEKLDDFSTRNSGECANGVSDVTGVYEHGPKVYQHEEQCVVDGIHVLPSTSVIGEPTYETSTLGNVLVSEQSAGGQVSSAGCHVIIDKQVAIDPSNLIRHAESLLEKLKLLQRSEPDQQSLVSKYILETEIRLSDVRSLSSHGSSLVPFWLHSERHLNQLENAINTEIEKRNNGCGMDLSSVEGTDKLQNGGESKVFADLKILPPEISRGISHNDDSAAAVQKYAHDKVAYDSHSTQLRSEDKDGNETDGAALPEKASPKLEFQSGEDVDMDVDMEVEEGELVASPDQLTQANPPTAEQSLGAESDFIVPPPPEPEWIPPPPPDSEGIPPPPPDEPPESCPPPPTSEPEPVQSIYSGQYNMTYAGSNYYDNSTDASVSSFYEHAKGSQVAPFNPAVYYATASPMLPAAVPTADSAVYYGLQNGMMPIVPVDSCTLGSSGFPTASGNLSYGQLSSQQIETPNLLLEASSHLIPHVDPVGPISSEVSSTSVVSTPATVSVKEYVSVPSYSAAATSITATSTSAVTSDVVPAPVSKPLSKTSRMKKPKVAVASSLRSNKKVSSLVDKWKAAKEELQEEEEEEPETALEILEKKRQREIEEWRAQQIASGEAKENANFQPLGGDWRERVKRRRAQKEATAESSLDATKDGSKQPDLNELSRDLPSGWQVYWDDSSKQVYYANAITSETTWTRPTR